MMIRTRGRRLVSRLAAIERIYDTQGPRVFRVIFEYGGEPTIVTIFRDENRTEITEPPPPDDDPDEFYGAFDSTETLDVSPAPQPDDEIPPSAVHGGSVLSMTCGRRGGLSHGFFTKPRVRGSASGIAKARRHSPTITARFCCA